MKKKPIIKGLVTLIPGATRCLPEKGTGGSDSALYCYGVWLKHLTMLWQHGMRSIPRTLAELGPGDSMGVGLAAMLSGVNTYYALDIIKHSDKKISFRILDELVALFESRAARPTKGWPDFDAYLDENLFPSHILTDERLKISLHESRIKEIQKAIKNMDSKDMTNKEITIKYMVPWSDDSIVQRNTVDVILSHSVLEHVEDIEKTYQSFSLWLKPQGIMTHQIDFSSHGLSDAWNGHRACSEFLWKIIMGRRPYLINRQPHSVHIKLMKQNQFSIICDETRHRPAGVRRSALADKWKDISENDLTCAGAFIQAKKQAPY